MALPQGIAFRQTAGFVTDGANDDAEYDARSSGLTSYPWVTTQGNSVGWETVPIFGDVVFRDRNSSIDPRLAGMAFNTSALVLDVWRFDLPATGSYNIRVAAGDFSYAAPTRIELFDTTTSLGALSSTDTTGSAKFRDATDAELSDTAWPGSNTSVSKSFSTTILRFKLGTTSHSDRIAYFNVDAPAGSATIIPSVGSLTISGNIPTITVSGSTTIQPASGSLAFIGTIPVMTLTLPSPATTSMILSGTAPVLIQGTVIVPSVGSIALAGIASVPVRGTVQVPAIGALVINGLAPTVSASDSTVIQPSAGALAFTAVAPGMLINTFIVPSVRALTLIGNAPTVTTIGSVSITPAVGSLLFNGVVAQISNSSIKNIRAHRNGFGFGFR